MSKELHYNLVKLSQVSTPHDVAPQEAVVSSARVLVGMDPPKVSPIRVRIWDCRGLPPLG